MACYFIENIHTTSFTPKEFQVELLDACRDRNTIVCLSPGSNRTFVTLKLLQELSLPIRRPWRCGGKRSLFIGSVASVRYYAELIEQLTDLTVGVFTSTSSPLDFDECQVVAVPAEVCASWTRDGEVPWDRFNLVILEDCHNALKNHPLREVILNLKGLCPESGLRLLGLTFPLFSSSQVQPGAVEAQLKQLEQDLSCRVETSSEIVSILRFNVRPKEILLECYKHEACPLSLSLAAEIHDLKEFLDDHRYDPSEIYEDSFLEELKDIPDPKAEPYEIISDFLEVLHSMGPWCADKAALVLLVQIEKLKVKTPYERHFLLFCVVSSVLLKIRAICDNTFQDLTETEKIIKYSSPKILRLIEVFRQFKPTNIPPVQLNRDFSITFNSNENQSLNNDLSHTSLDKSSKESSPEDSNSNSINSCKNKLPSPSGEPCFVCGKVNCSGSIENEKKTKFNGLNEDNLNKIICICDETSANECTMMNGGINEVKESKLKILDIQISSEVPVTGSEVPLNDTTGSKVPVNGSEGSLSEVPQNCSEGSLSDCTEASVTGIIELQVPMRDNTGCEVPLSGSEVNENDTTQSKIPLSDSTETTLRDNAGCEVSDTGCEALVTGSTEFEVPVTENEILVNDTRGNKGPVGGNTGCEASMTCNTEVKVPLTGSEASVNGSTVVEMSVTNSETSLTGSNEVKVPVTGSEASVTCNTKVKVPLTGSEASVSGSTVVEVPVTNSETSLAGSNEVKVPVTGSTVVEVPVTDSEASVTGSTLVEVPVTDSGSSMTGSNEVKVPATGSEVSVTSTTVVEMPLTSSEVPVTVGTQLNVPVSDSSGCEVAVPSSEAPVTSSEMQPSVTGRRERWRGRGRGWRQRKIGTGASGQVNTRPVRHQASDDAENLCGIIFVQKRFTAKILYHLFHDLHRCDPDFFNINAQYTVDKVADPFLEPREAEIEHKKQEEVLKRFRMRECNLVIATSVLEEGMELPKCNLVLRYDPVASYRSHAYSKGRAKHPGAFYICLVQEETAAHFLQTYAQYKCTEQLLLSRSTNHEMSEVEEREADGYTGLVPPYRPTPDGPYVDLSSSIALVNRYCAKLPSDTFTRLTPLWSMARVHYNGRLMDYCSVRLPINSPLKQDILGHPMPSRVLARRMAALETCRLLHSRGELDDNLEPIGKESFNSGFDEEDLSPVSWDPDLPRPGTTKSRQYYYKRIASCLNDCRPQTGVKCFLYNLELVLSCPLPEEQNTRGRKLHPPELASQGFGILTAKQIPKICPFPIFTRSGEVEVSLRLSPTQVVLSQRHVATISTFLNFIFTSVLRLQKYLMSFDPSATENSFFIVPTKKNCEGVSEVDWDFLEVIYQRKDESPHLIPDEERKEYVFEPDKYTDAVVMPWYRNQDQPQYFYVAEICYQLNPKSGFPGSSYNTFEDYYLKKYNIQIQNTSQPLLDVDHTSARLNFLTPRYVNRKGVALPTSSEETKRAKRENLEQKQILVGELCQVHVVPASLWRQAVCLPCILYRLNALLLADEIRAQVAAQVGLGLVNLPKGFEWPPLDFGWSLADVLNKSKKDAEKKDIQESGEQQKSIGTNEITDGKTSDNKLTEIEEDVEMKEKETKNDEDTKKSDDKVSDDLPEDATDKVDDEEEGSDEDGEKDKDENWMEIGTWSNEMAQLANDLDKDLPPGVSMVRYGSPTSWDVTEDRSFDYYSSEGESGESDDDAFLESATSDSSDSGVGRLKITFKGDYLAEAVEEEEESGGRLGRGHQLEELSGAASGGEAWCWEADDLIPQVKENIYDETKRFEAAIQENVEIIKSTKILVGATEPLLVERGRTTNKSGFPPAREDPLQSAVPPASFPPERRLPIPVEGYSMPSGLVNPSRTVCSPPPSSPPPSPVLEITKDEDEELFSFDAQPELTDHPGPSPSILLQALTMSNANDGINLERLETIGDSFLKYAITTYLYCTHENIHEGKLSHLRSKQVSNLKLYRLGQKKALGERMIASKFEPHDNWLPPCYLVPRESEEHLLDTEPEETVPYNLVTQHSIPDKSIADCVEALIGAYLIECGPRGALIFMSWLGIKVLPRIEIKLSPSEDPSSAVVSGRRPVGSIITEDNIQVMFTELGPPASPLLRHVPDPEGELAALLSGFEVLEASLRYSFRDRSYLLQAMSHASYSPNRVTDCYQRLEFLGDAVLDYLITRHLFEDKRAHSPGALTDLRSALVNNTIFASLAVKHGLHKYFRHLSPGLAEVVQRFVTIQEENSHSISEEYYLVGEEAEDVEVPKALGDVFESIAGAVFLDSGMSLDTVWKVYYRMMKKEIEQFSAKVPKSPIRELLELEPETAKFSKPEKLADGRRVRVTVEVFGKGTFKGIGRNYRIAKCTAAKCALKQLKIGLLARKYSDYPSQSLLKVLRACHDMKHVY